MGSGELRRLSDDELIARAQQWRRLALRGALHARGHAHEHEVEVRRRFAAAGVAATAADGEADAVPTASVARRRPFWRFWRRG